LRAWPVIKVVNVESGGTDSIQVGSELKVKAKVTLGPLKPDDVQVQLFYGLVDSFGEIPAPQTVTMSANGQPAKDSEPWEFTGVIACRSSGQHGFAVRVLPKHQDLNNVFEPGLVCWG
jgi:starch phosphorylase